MSLQLTPSSSFLSQLDDLNDKLLPILDDYEKYYVFYHKNPEYTEYQNMFDNIKGNLQKVNTQQAQLKTDIQTGTNYLSDQFKELDENIEREKEKNKKLRKKLGIAESKYDGSAEMIKDFKHEYNMYYMKNFGVLLGILMISYTVTKLN